MVRPYAISRVNTQVFSVLFMTNCCSGRKGRLGGEEGLDDAITAGAEELEGCCGEESKGGSKGARTDTVSTSSIVDIR